ncbi:MAG: CHAT domain-containing protein [Candidatus Eisenbacteria bacterium]
MRSLRSIAKGERALRLRRGACALALVFAAACAGAFGAACAAVPAPSLASRALSRPRPLLPPATPLAPDLARVERLRLAGRPDSALPAIERLREQAEAQGDSGRMLWLGLREGELRASIGAAREGETILRRCLAIARARGDSASACVAIRWLSVAVANQGRTEEARALYDSLAVLARLRGDRVQEGWALVGIGWDQVVRGSAVEAASTLDRAIALFRAGGERRGEAWARNSRGVALGRTGAYERSREEFARAAVLADSCRYPMVTCLARNNLGTLEYRLGDPAKAATAFDEALASYRDYGEMRESIVPGMNLALCAAELGDPEQACDSLEAMLAICEREGYGDLRAKLLRQLGQTRASQGRTREARRIFRQILAADPPAPAATRAAALAAFARTCESAQERAEAIAILEGALARAEIDGPEERGRLAARLGELRVEEGRPAEALAPLRLAAGLSARPGLDAVRLETLLALARAFVDLGRPDSARASLEAAARVWEAQRGLPLDPEWREQRSAAGRSIATSLAGLLLGADPEKAAGPSAVRAAYERVAVFKARTLLERIAGPATALPRSAAASALLPPLEPGELLLDYHLGGRASWLFAFTRDSCCVRSLPPEGEIEPGVRLVLDLFASPDSARGAGVRECRMAAAALCRALLPDLGDWVAKSDRILVAADGVAHLAPFESFDAAGDGRDREWTRIASPAILAGARAAEAGAAGADASAASAEALLARPILAVAAPQAGTIGLPGAAREAKRIARAYRGVDLRVLGPRDTLGLADLAAPRLVVHFAAHALGQDGRPWLSEIALGARPLHAKAIAASRIPARLAVLSCCRTARGAIVSGEGMQGLSTALLCSGASSVAATLWPVEDEAAQRFAACFYDELAGGATVSGALMRAREAIREDPRTRHPFFWAGFVVLGDGSLRIPIQPARPVPWGRLALAGGAAFVLLGIVLRSFSAAGERPEAAGRTLPPGPEATVRVTDSESERPMG